MFTSRTLQFKLILFSLVFFSTLFYFLRRTSSVFFVTQFHQRYAYATFLGPPSVSGELDKDPYFTSVRLLAFQILHANRTRTRMEPQIPFLVLALPTVPAHCDEMTSPAMDQMQIISLHFKNSVMNS